MTKLAAPNTIYLPTSETVHDYRPLVTSKHWHIVNFNKVGDNRAQILGVGLGLEPGHFVIFRHNGVDMAWIIEQVTYSKDPRDCYAARIEGAYEIDDKAAQVINLRYAQAGRIDLKLNR